MHTFRCGKRTSGGKRVSDHSADPASPCGFATQQQVELQQIAAARAGTLLSPSQDPRDPLHMGLLGLACSGGGIRSATFNLGVLQGLARLGLLRRLDYLSTVSGGGYIGSWLSAWVYRAKGGILEVERHLSQGHSGPRATPADGSAAGASAAEPAAVKWLRRYSNYLTPRLGLLGADTLTAVSIYLRNLLLNQTILVSLTAVLLLVPWLVILAPHLVSQFMGAKDIATAGAGAAVPLTLLLFIALLCAGGGMALAGYQSAWQAGERPALASFATRSRWVVGLLVMAAFILGWMLPAVKDLSWLWSWSGLLLAFLSLLGGFALGWLKVWRSSDSAQNPLDPAPNSSNPGTNSSDSATNRIRLPTLASLIGGLAGATLLIALVWVLVQNLPERVGFSMRLHLLVWGPPLVTLILLLALTLFLGLAGRAFRDPLREWWGRIGAYQLHLALVWLVVSAATVYGPYAVLYLGNWVQALGGLWGLITLAGVWAAKSPSTGGRDGSVYLELLAKFAPYLFGIGLLILVAFGLYHGLERMTGDNLGALVCTDQSHPAGERPAYRVQGSVVSQDQKSQPEPEPQTQPEPQTKTKTVTATLVELSPRACCKFDDYAAGIEVALDSLGWQPIVALVLLLVSIGLLTWRVDINVFSLHMFYRNRLERCYLGASQGANRSPDPFTNLCSSDAPRLRDLARSAASGHPQRPLHIINTALNLTNTRNLAWQERKAASFTFTPWYCGYELDPKYPAYQPTEEYVQCPLGWGQPGWISLGLPLTISGAAASPNAGYHTNPVVAFLLTVFNVRLGWWLQNPRYGHVWRKPGPFFSLKPLVQELLGSANEESNFLYLSDGGHFENLGIYELVRRRCRYIIACDAGCDPDYRFEDLGNAIRKIRVDLGVDIRIDVQGLIPDPQTKHSRVHCAVGTIPYRDAQGRGARGYLLYLKASLTGDEPADVRQYQAAHGDFPHQSTADQWFSESQFESYRTLGLHALTEAIEEAARRATATPTGVGCGSPDKNDPAPGNRHRCNLEELFAELYEHWYPPARAQAGAFSRHGETLDGLFARIRSDPYLRFLDAQVYPAWPSLTARVPEYERPDCCLGLPDGYQEIRAGFYLCNALFQLMENVYLDLNLEEEWDHPDNRGWMNYFRHWSWSAMVRYSWAISAPTYGARFQKFCAHRLGMEVGQVLCAKPIPVAALDKVDLDKVAAAAQSLLNPIEIGLVRTLAGAPDLKGTSLEVLPLRLAVPNPLLPQAREATALYTFAFALVQRLPAQGTLTHHELVYYRVQNHLRRTNLGRAGLVQLRRRYPGLVLRPRRLPSAIRDFEHEHDTEGLQRLWASVEAAE